MLGRVTEVGRIDELLSRAVGERQSSALIVHGEPGVGKTRLLKHVLERADGLTVLRVRPLDAEAELAFAGLFDLVRPIQHLLDRLPAPQRAALAGALALGPPAPGDRFAVAAATLSLLAAAADEAPVLALVDDAQWLDASSREAILFAARRLSNEGVVLLLAMREREWLHSAGLATLELRGLAGDDAAALIVGTGAAIDSAVRRRVVEETRGNPLAILEAIDTLSDAQLRGTIPIAEPLAVGDALERAYAQQLQDLPADTRQALLIASASTTGDAGEIVSALAAARLDLAALEPAESAGLITLHDRIEFRHPLIRSAAYHHPDPARRRAAHRAHADALGPGERAIWHVAATATAPDEDIAGQLEAIGGHALARSAYAAAGSTLVAAAELSPEPDARLRRTVSAGRALWLGGEPARAASVLEGVLALATEPAIRADIQQLRGAAGLFTRPLGETVAILAVEAERVQPHDGARAGQLYANAAMACIPYGAFERAEEYARRALAGGPSATFAARVLLRTIFALRSDIAGATAELEAALADEVVFDPLSELYTVTIAHAQTMAWIEQWELAEHTFGQLIAAARAAGAPGVLEYPLSILADYELRRGHLAASYAAAAESVQLATHTRETATPGFGLVVLARIEAVLGLERESRAHANAALGISRAINAAAVVNFASGALGMLELSLGRAERAAGHLAECAELEETYGVQLPSVAMSAGDYVEALVRARRPAEALRALASLEARADKAGLRWPSAVAARCRGLVADERFEPEFADALELFGDDMLFERARTLLCLGMRRRRAQQRAGARRVLREALEYFDTAGSRPWAEQARTELRATGETPQPATNGSLRELTSQELQVALIVAKGATNKETAAALFLSEKTIEFHLRNTYRKLRVRSRSELVRCVEGIA